MSQIWSTHCSTLSEKSHSYGLRYLFNSTLWKKFLGENSAGFLQKKHKPKTTQPIHAHSVWTKPYCSTASNEGSISQIATFEVIRKFFHTSIDVHNWAQPAAKALSSHLPFGSLAIELDWWRGGICSKGTERRGNRHWFHEWWSFTYQPGSWCQTSSLDTTYRAKFVARKQEHCTNECCCTGKRVS